MNKSLLVFVYLFNFSITVDAQDVLFEKEMSTDYKNMDHTYTLFNASNNQLSLFLMDNDNIASMLIDSTFKLLSKLVIKKSPWYSTFLGSRIDSGMPKLYFLNDRHDKLLIKSIDFEKKLSKDKLIDVKLEDEKYVKSFNYKNSILLVSILKKSSKLKVYIFDENNKVTSQEFDFSKKLFRSRDDEIWTLYDVLSRTDGFKIIIDIQKIKEEDISSLKLMSPLNKIYLIDSKIYLTIDNEITDTKIITIDLKDFSSSIKFYKQRKVDCDDALKTSSNSQIFKGVLYQIKGCKEELCFSAYDLVKDTFLREFRVRKNDSVTFKNTPFMKEQGKTLFTTNTKKVSEETTSALKKIGGNQVAIAVYQLKDTLSIITGSCWTTYGSSYDMGYFRPDGTFSSSGFGNTIPISNTVYFTSLFDKSNYNHLEGKTHDNPSQKIDKFLEDENAFSSIKVFKIQEYFVLAYYNKKDKKYYMKKFTEY